MRGFFGTEQAYAASDDNAIIIIGGKPAAAATMKTELRADAPVRAPGTANPKIIPGNDGALGRTPVSSYSGGTAPSAAAGTSKRMEIPRLGTCHAAVKRPGFLQEE